MLHLDGRQVHQVEEIRQRLGRVGQGVAADDDRLVLPAVGCAATTAQRHIPHVIPAATETGLAMWQRGRNQRISSGFYTSQGFELTRL